MDFRDVRCGMSQAGDGMRSAMNALEACDELWKSSPEVGYGPGELMIHICQVAKFTQAFVGSQLRLPGSQQPFVLSDKLAPAVNDLLVLRRVNLTSARTRLASFPTLLSLRTWVNTKCNSTYVWVSGLPDDRAHMRVTHPLVKMECGAATMLYRQLVVHAIYHLGQLTQQMKDANRGEHVPHLPIFGGFISSPVLAGSK